MMNKSILEKYTIFSFLNKGASASVYMAMNNHTRRLVALKMIALDKTDPVIKEKALYEIEVMKKISNFFVVSLYDYYVDDDYVYIIMEYCENGSLNDMLLGRNKLNEKQASVIIFETLIALIDLKSKGIIHRDLKLDNILIDIHGHVRLADFGLAKIHENEALKTSCGTPLYVSPELILKEKYDERTDIWSLGVIFYYLLYGKFPFYSENINEMFTKIIKEQPELSDQEVSSEANDLIMRMLDKNMDTRITFEGIFNHPFMRMNNPLSYVNMKESSDYNVYTQSWVKRNQYKTGTFDNDASKITNIDKQELIKMVENSEINESTACYKILRDFFLKDFIFSQFGGYENEYRTTTNLCDDVIPNKPNVFRPQFIIRPSVSHFDKKKMISPCPLRNIILKKSHRPIYRIRQNATF